MPLDVVSAIVEVPCERGVLRGKQMFQRAMAHFEGRFTAIRGTWLRSTGNQLDNLDAFNRALKHVASPEEAALATTTENGQPRPGSAPQVLVAHWRNTRGPAQIPATMRI